jgi:tetratricopeptide (TPR) repeat protein
MNRFERLEFQEHTSQDRKGRGGEQLRDAGFFYKKGLTMELAGDFECALRNYSRSVEENVNFLIAWEGQVRMLTELEEYKEAQMWADKALEIFPSNASLMAAKAQACFRDAYAEKALAYSDNAISKKDITPLVWLVRTEIMAAKKTAIAESCTEKALNLCQTESEKGIALLGAGRIMLRYKKYISAIDKLSRASMLLPKAPLVWYELGMARYLGKTGDSFQAFEHCLTLREEWPQAKTMLAKSGRGFFRRINIFR